MLCGKARSSRSYVHRRIVSLLCSRRRIGDARISQTVPPALEGMGTTEASEGRAPSSRFASLRPLIPGGEAVCEDALCHGEGGIGGRHPAVDRAL